MTKLYEVEGQEKQIPQIFKSQSMVMKKMKYRNPRSAFDAYLIYKDLIHETFSNVDVFFEAWYLGYEVHADNPKDLKLF